MAGSRPVTPASPKILKTKPQIPGTPLYGCEHLQRLLTKSQDITTNSIAHYKMLLRVVFDNTPVVPQTSKAGNGPHFTSLTPNYLCLQCPATVPEEERPKHGKLKAHMFYVDSRSGGLFCQMCDDFVFDPTLEELRLRKIGTGTFQSRKRKYDELFTGSIKDDPKQFTTNGMDGPCDPNGLRGIYNMGATCFMSVILQSFIHNPLIRNFYLSDGHQSGGCCQENCLSCSMDHMFQDFYGQDHKSGFSASNILSSSWHTQQAAFAGLAGNDEQDAHEFFQFLAEELHKSTKEPQATQVPGDSSRPQSRSGSNCECIVHQTFYGKLQSTLTCQHCEVVTTSVEPFLDLSLGLENIIKKRGGKGGKGGKGGAKRSRKLTLQRCLDDEYKLPERCGYTCTSCDQAQEGTKQLSIKRLPNVLCIQFKRFEHDKAANSTSKIDVKVQFPLQVNMLPYTSRKISHGAQENYELARSCIYDLLSVVVHSGGKMHTGHYISYSRVGNQWFKFDDHKVTMVTESQVLGAEAFILFYMVRSLA